MLQALGALLNLTVTEEFKSDVGGKGVLKIALGIIDTYIHALRGMMYDCNAS